jgi:hypothetical protein
LLLATQFGSENWFPAGRTLWQQKLVRCKHLNFDSKCYFAATDTLSVADANSQQATRFWQRITLPL